MTIRLKVVSAFIINIFCLNSTSSSTCIVDYINSSSFLINFPTFAVYFKATPPSPPLKAF